jgi:hypothetical protein
MATERFRRGPGENRVIDFGAFTGVDRPMAAELSDGFLLQSG